MCVYAYVQINAYETCIVRTCHRFLLEVETEENKMVMTDSGLQSHSDVLEAFMCY